MQWIVAGSLAVAAYPAHKIRQAAMPIDPLARWITEKQLEGTRSILCLFEPHEMPAYERPLLQRHRETGFEADQYPLPQDQILSTTDQQLAGCWFAYWDLPEPVLIQGRGEADEPAHAAANFIAQKIGMLALAG